MLSKYIDLDGQSQGFQRSKVIPPDPDYVEKILSPFTSIARNYAELLARFIGLFTFGLGPQLLNKFADAAITKAGAAAIAADAAKVMVEAPGATGTKLGEGFAAAIAAAGAASTSIVSAGAGAEPKANASAAGAGAASTTVVAGGAGAEAKANASAGAGAGAGAAAPAAVVQKGGGISSKKEASNDAIPLTVIGAVLLGGLFLGLNRIGNVFQGKDDSPPNTRRI